MALKNLYLVRNHSQQTEQTLDEQLRFERLLAEISIMFVRLSYGMLDEIIESALKKLLVFFQMDRCGLVRVSRRDQTWQVTHVAYGDHIPPVLTNEDMSISDFPWVFRSVVEEQKVLSIKSTDDMPPEAAIDRQTCQRMGIRSFIDIPVATGGYFDYLVFTNSVTEERSWPSNIVPRLRLIGELFSQAVERSQAQSELERELTFKHFVSQMAARFINIKDEEFDAEIECGLKRFAECLGFDRALVAQFSPDSTTAELKHHWEQTGMSPPRALLPLADIPWISGKVLRNAAAIISDVNELATTADSDRALLTDIGARSGIFLPLKCEGLVTGFVSFVDQWHKRLFSDELLTNLKLAADMLANALSRQSADKAIKRHLQEIERLKKQLEQENFYLREEVELKASYKTMVCHSAAMKKVLAQVEKVAPTDSSVLIQGETGTGKELIARAIHAQSARNERPLVTVNCASLSPTLIESDLFGREKGAYTGALTRMAGRFEIADNCTVFLDEIGELPLGLQSKLLRVLEEGCFERLGSTKTMRVNVRIIAATNRDLSKEVDAGKFRKDLYYRLCVFPIYIPPLRERPEDIPPMAWTFVKHYRSVLSKPVDHIPRRVMEALLRYSWPGNARELRNVIEHAIIVSWGTVLEPVLPCLEPASTPNVSQLKGMERSHIENVLNKCGWRISGPGGAAEALGLNRTTLQSKMKKLCINRPTARIRPK